MIQKTNKHMIKTYIDMGLLHDMAQAGELRFSKHGHVFGIEKYIEKSFRGKK